jgi:hypothetical protein
MMTVVLYVLVLVSGVAFGFIYSALSDIATSMRHLLNLVLLDPEDLTDKDPEDYMGWLTSVYEENSWSEEQRVNVNKPIELYNPPCSKCSHFVPAFHMRVKENDHRVVICDRDEGGGMHSDFSCFTSIPMEETEDICTD